MSKICTTLEQSKKLIEIGIDVYTADMFWKNGVSNEYIQCFTPFVSSGTNVDFDYDIPAWSLTALLDILKSEIDGEEGECYQLNIEKDGAWWNVFYKEQYDGAKPIETESAEELVDACYKMIIKFHDLNMF